MSRRPSFRSKPKKNKESKNPKDMMAQVQQMQSNMAEAQSTLSEEEMTVTAGGGAITVVITGHQRLKSIALDPELIDPEEIEMLQDMLVAAVNTAIEQSQTMAAAKMENITGNLGGLNDLLGGLGLG